MKPIKFSNVFIINLEGKVLVLRRTIEHATKALALDLPGGGLEPGESFEQAAIREVKEETGIDIRLDDLELIRRKEHNLSERSIEGAIYVVRIKALEIPIKLSNEHDEYYWIKPSKLKNLPAFHQESLNFALINGFLS